MKTFRTLACIAGMALLSGCLSGCAGMGQVLRDASAAQAELDAQMPTTRNYFTNPYVGPAIPQTAQPSWGSPSGERYRTIMVNTPQGIVYKQCKVLSTGAVYCI